LENSLPEFGEEKHVLNNNNNNLQALAAELKAGFTGAMHELNRIQHGDQFVEERIRAFGTEWQEQLKEMKDTFRTFKEELQGAHNQIREMSERQREMKEYIEMLQQENDWIQTKPLAHNRSNHVFQMIILCFNFLVKRQQAAVELLESERAYMFYLSLILKTSVTVKGKDVILNSKDLRNIFPSSLRVLTQQHVCVLHTLEERVFRWQWQGIVGDIFMKLINGDDNILKYTEQNHPDYYLLLLCIQQFQTFMCRCSHLFQYNEELLTQNRAELKRLTVPQSRLKVSEKNQSMKSDEWEFTPQRYERFDNPDYRPFYTSELDLGPKSSTLKSALEVDSETCCRETRGYFNSNKARSIIGPSCPICPSETYAKNFPADYKTFLNRGEGELGHEEQETSCNPDDEESIQNASLLDQCSFASSDSSLDVRFMKTLNYIPARDPESTGCSLVLTPKHSAVEEDTDAIHKHLCYEAGHPVFNEAQTENYARNIMENVKIPISLSLSNIGSPALKTEGASLSQIKGSINKRLQKTITSSSRSEVDNKQTTDVWMELERVI
uniref:DH domain-containing protein n=1 Tax=Callorhinchus milii TaxID=7868 RepID=A0A4W3H7W6_CALMI